MSYFISFLFWLIFGSFISVLVWRIKNNEKGILFWRSKCPKCNHVLQPNDLIPILSYIFLKWKCRYCWNKISIIYPILELATWLTFVFITYLLLWTGNIDVFLNNLFLVIYWWIVWVFFVALAFYDILFYEISFILAGILWVLLLLPQIFWIIWDLKQAIIFSFSWLIVFVLISFVRLKLRKIEWLWGWDAIWAALIGLVYPILYQILWLYEYPGWVGFYILLMIGFFLAAFVWLFGLIFKKYNFLSKLPFLPFMFLWIVVFVFYWKDILSWLFSWF